MFAVIKTGGKQYRVAAGDVITVEKLAGEAGDKISFGEVLMVNDGSPKFGAPLVKGASVAAELISTEKGEKVVVIKNKRRNTYRRKRGHRQIETKVKITGITV